MAGVLKIQIISRLRHIVLVLLFPLSVVMSSGANAEDDILVSGVNEFETGMSRDSGSLTTADPAISKIELQINSPESRPFGGLVRFKHEVDVDEVDEAYLRYQSGVNNGYAVIGGKYYSPFGQFDSSLITDPMTLTVGESRLQGLTLERDRAGLATSIFASADSPDSGDNAVAGVGLNYHRGEEWSGYGFGIAGINNLAAANGIREALTTPGTSTRAIPALAAHVTYGDGINRIIVEAVSATERFAVGDLAFAGAGARPEALRAEVGRRFQFLNKPVTVAASWQQSREALALELPQTRIAAGLSTELSRNASLALEWLHDTAYPVAFGGSGDTNDTLTLQFALTF